MSGKFDQAAGKVKKATGDAIGNERLQAEGKAQNSEGHVSEIASKVEGYAQGLGNQIKGALNSGMNSLTGNTSGEAEGKIQKTAGKAQKEWNA